LRRSRTREKLTLQQRWAVRPDVLRRALLDFNPQILHFCGHGSGENGLVLENDTGEAKLVSTEALANLLKRFADRGLECVVLNACYSEVQANAIIEHIDYVIGMNSSISDRAAIKFVQGFYDELGAGWSYEDAFQGGCDAIALEGIQQEHIPILKRKSQFKKPSSPNEPDIQIPATLGSENSKLKGNYDQLQSLLAEKNWKEADWETMQILLRIAERTEQGWLLSIDEIPSEDIRKIDFLWLDASKGKFGYNVQKNIWLNVQGELGVFDTLVFYKFAKQVGWQVNEQLRMNYDDFDFSLNAPNGHLPTFRFPSDTDQLGTWLDAFKDFLPRL
jgi:hypothetical protein